MPEGESVDKREKKAASPPQGIGEEIDLFVNQIDALAETLPLAVLAIQGARKASQQKLMAFFKEECETVMDGTKATYTFDAGQYPKYQSLMRRVKRADLAAQLVPRGLLVALISQFDAYVGGLIKQLFKLKPEIVSSSENVLTFSQLTAFGSIEAAREYVIDKEIESVLRKSHSEQFDWLENKFGIKLRENLPAWPLFIEVTERRNLFVHTNGVVSHQYLEACRKHSCQVPEDVCLGQSLPLKREYFAAAYECLLEIGVKLGQVLWRKVQSSEILKADENLTTVTYDLILEGRYQLARILLDFGTQTLKKHSTEENRLRLLVNRAQAHKWSGNDEECKRILDGEDWSAASLSYKLAHSVLLDDFKEANKLIKQIGRNGEVDKHSYRDWPLFKELRKSPEFNSIFEQVFGEALNRITVKDDDAGPIVQ